MGVVTRSKKAAQDNKRKKKQLSRKGAKKKLRQHSADLKKLFHKPGHWKVSDPGRFYKDLVYKFMDSCKNVKENYDYFEKRKNKS